jgi:hypothetical protein
VAVAFDLTLIPLYRVKGQEWPQLPGLLASAPPKRAARGRENDSLVVYLTLTGNTPVSTIEYNQLAERMAERFYQTPGALTSALRTSADAINQFLLERNLVSASQGQHLIGRLVMGVLREGVFTFAQSGPTAVFQLTSGEVRQVADASVSGRGLGVGQATPLYLAQTEVHAADRFIFCAYCPEGWNANVTSQRGTMSLDVLRRSLFDTTAEDINAILLQTQPGKGTVNLLHGERTTSAPVPAPTAPQAQTPPVSQTAASAESKPESAPPPPTRLDLIQPGRFVRPLKPSPQAQAPAEIPVPTPAEERKIQAEPVERPEPKPNRFSRFIAPRVQSEIPEIARARSTQNQGLYRGLAKTLRSIRLSFGKISSGIKNGLPRLLPTLQENEPQHTTSAMALVAIIVPLMVVTVAVMFYLRYGQRSQYEQNYQMAVSAAVGAIGQTDPAIVRHAWESTLFYLEKAESYQVTTESQALRQQAQTEIDGLDGIVRLDFKLAVAVDRSVAITRMAATDTDLYLLDANHGTILRAFMTNTGYQMDPTFQCGPATYSGQQVGSLIDLAAMPGGNMHNATVVGMDAAGTLLYCAPQMTPEAFPLAVPELGWKQITAFTLSSDRKTLYVLDPTGNAVWVYSGLTGNFIDPYLFFGNYIPTSMDQVIDLTVNASDLFLLFRDSHITSCTYGDESRTRCTDPLTFVDTRAGHSSGGPTLADAVFSQMVFDNPFDTSLYLLEPKTHAIFQSSPRPGTLELNGQFRASAQFDALYFTSDVSAITIGTNRYIFLCVGNQIYYADMP